jgi:hypothetical protein
VNRKRLMVLAMVFMCAAQARAAAAGEGSERAPLDLQLAKVQRQSLLKEKTLIDEKLQQVFRQRVDLERRKRVIEEEKLMYLLSRRLCSDKRPAAVKPEVYPLPKPNDAGDRLDQELDSLLDKQNKLTERGLALENELKAATER